MSKDSLSVQCADVSIESAYGGLIIEVDKSVSILTDYKKEVSSPY